MKQTKRSTPYQGDDIKDFINANKTYSSASHAYKDAKYAEWFESDAEMSDMKLFCCEMLTVAMPLIILAVVVAVVVCRTAV